jgi:hypothetical protein
VDDSTRRTGRGTSLNGKWRRKLQDKEWHYRVEWESLPR